jgi:dienelactone hydrolase
MTGNLVAVTWLALALTLAHGYAAAQEGSSRQIPTPFSEAGQPVTLELVYFKPPGPGPFPAVLFTHGSTNNGNDLREVRYTAVYADLASYFNERGWMVAFLQRRGRGQSGGAYAEGWDASQGRYACDLEVARSSRRRALEDVDAAYAFVANDPLVDRKRMLIGGHSRGGVLALAYAAEHPERFVGALNFVGGWAGQRCDLMKEINQDALSGAGKFPKPTLWLYGERDPLFTPEQTKSLFAGFVESGGKGSFHVVSYGPLRNDHQLIRSRALWQEQLSRYLDGLAVPEK